MLRIQRLHLLAAALTLVGAAGLVYALTGLLAEPELGVASDDPLIFSIGDVPEPIGVMPTGVPDRDGSIPALPDRSDDQLPSTNGRYTRGANPEPGVGGAELPTAEPQSSGASTNGVRNSASLGIDPTSIRIPKINVDASIVQVGTTDAGAMEAPRRYSDVGWWSLGAQPGETGRAVLAGHVDSPWGAAVFIRLDDLVPGDEILVGNGETELRYLVRGAAVYRAEDAPVDDIFGPSVERELILITCGGRFDRRTASYLHRRVVFAVLVDDGPTGADEAAGD